MLIATGPNLLDADALARLRELDPDGRAGVLQRVMRTYESSLQRTLPALVQARLGQDHDEIGRLAHTLKSSSASVGALALSRSCAEVEALARKLQTGDFDAAVERLFADAAAASAAVRDMLR